MQEPPQLRTRKASDGKSCVSARRYFHLWINPCIVIFGFVGGLATISAITPEVVFQNEWKINQKIFSGDYLFIIFTYIAAFSVGFSVFGLNLNLKSSHVDNIKAAVISENHRNVLVLSRLYYLSMILALLASGIWLINMFKNGLTFDLLLGVFSQEYGSVWVVKTLAFNTIPGVTTLTQLGPCAAVLFAILPRKDKIATASFAILIIVATLRAIIVSERIAIIEVILPFLLVYTQMWWLEGSRYVAIMIKFFPILMPAAAILIFGGFEFFRTWTEGRESGVNFIIFALGGLISYYVTAFNNGAAILENVQVPVAEIPYGTLGWLWSFPGLGKLLLDLINPSFIPFEGWYYTFLPNPDLNSPCGLFVFTLDFGFFGGTIMWVLVGVIAGFLFSGFSQDSIFGVLIYPIFFVGLLELPRVMVWTAGRNLPTWLFLGLSYLLIKNSLRNSVGRQRVR